MMQEQKELLIKDLCARLPYGLNCEIYHKYRYYDMRLSGVLNNEAYFTDNNGSLYIDYENVKPYLFPLSSMTDEQKRELNNLVEESVFQILHSEDGNPQPQIPMDWYNKNHFDYRGLIPMALAIDATGKNIY